MEDLLLAEEIQILKGHDVILCGEGSLAQKLKDWLDGSGLTVYAAKEPSLVMEYDLSPGAWIFLPNDALDEWKEALRPLREKNGQEIRLATLGALNYAMITSGEKLFEENKKQVLMEKIDKERQQIFAFAQKYMGNVDLRDTDCEEVLEKNPVLAYGNAKVGTTSIYDSLLAAGIPARHLHSVTGDKIIKTLLEHPGKVKILSGVREPLARDLSAFFQTQAGFFEYDASKGDFKNRIEHMMGILWETARNFGNGGVCAYGYSFGWYDVEFKNKLGIDIFEQPFDKEKGYTIYRKGSVEIFLYRLEDLNSLEGEIQKFLGRDDFKILHTNNAEEKNISFIYKELKEKYSFPKGWVKLYYDDNERVDYFYTKEEQAAFLKKWNITEL
ncbi:MAG: hypothetical protein IJ682_14215 [Lachnospiraceae bacterium]|nr:hypothetical protein [Lachnospiraceae bacterium]